MLKKSVRFEDLESRIKTTAPTHNNHTHYLASIFFWSVSGLSAPAAGFFSIFSVFVPLNFVHYETSPNGS